MIDFSATSSVFQVSRESFPEGEEGTKQFDEIKRIVDNLIELQSEILRAFTRRPVDGQTSVSDPDNNRFIIYQESTSGDVIVKTTDTNGTTKTTTIADFSAL